MAELGDIQVEPQTGQPHKLGPNGWEPISVQQADQESQPAFGRFIGGLGGGEATGTAGALGRAVGIGTAVAEPAFLLGRAGVRAAVGGARRQLQQSGRAGMPQRVQQQIQQVTKPETPVFGALPGEGGFVPPAPRAGPTSVGAAQAGAAPQPAGLMARIVDKFLDQRPLRTDQARIVQSGRAQELGFRHLPGEQQGQNLLVAGAKSDPIVAGAFDDILTGNREALNRNARKALGLEDAPEFGRAELGEAAQDIGARLNQVADDIKPATLDKDLANRINKLRKVDDDLDDALSDALGVEGAAADATVSGQELLGMRSQLGKASRQAWKQGAAQRGERIDKIIKKLDDLIEQQSTNPAARAEYAKAREQWRVLTQLEKPGVVSEAGDIQAATLARNFTKEFKGDFGRTTFARPDSKLSQETKDLLDFTKISSAFKDSVGDSGTATRLGFQSLLNPKALTQRALMRTAMEQIVKQGG